MQPKHQKVTKYIKLEDGGVKIVSDSYYEQLSQHIEEIEKNTLTSPYTLKQDVEHALSHITEDGALRLILTIETKNGEPTKIVKRWTTLKQSYPRK